MVSKIVCLSLLAALASTVNAYYWHVEIYYQTSTLTGTRYKIRPIDLQVPGSVVLVKEGDISQTADFYLDAYDEIKLSTTPTASGLELNPLEGVQKMLMETIPCTKMDEFQQNDITTKVYDCTHPDIIGKKGLNRPLPTTTTPAPVPTTTCPAVTVTVPVTVATTNPPQTTTNPPKPTTTPPKSTTTPPKPTPTCLSGYRGKRNGKGPDGACCSDSDDCKDTCVKGICRDRCLTGYKGKGNGEGPNGACCSHSDDCKDTCVKGICGVHP
ncbi:MAG: hypothetical protein J3Q66DRAFT_357052 [Benniella sp.]|nr:MAG: hypothetical protein J3Q66DRAFT_357052 [Benniella sp.]